MVLEDFIPDVALDFGKLLLTLQALGIILFVWLGFQIISFILSRKKVKTLALIRKDIKKLDKKITLIQKSIKK